MVAVGVGAGDGDETAAAERRHDRLDMAGQIGPRIDYHRFRVADQIGLGAGEGIRRGIVREQAGDAGLEQLQDCIRGVHGAAVP